MTAPEVFAPARLGPVELRNRVIKAATFEGRTPHGLVTDEFTGDAPVREFAAQFPPPARLASQLAGGRFLRSYLARALLREPGLLQRIQADPPARSLCVHCNKCMPTIYTGTRCVLVPPGT